MLLRISFKNLVYTPEAHLVKLSIEDKEYRAVLKDMQFHPVKDNILHADFIEIFENKPVVINIPIKVIRRFSRCYCRWKIKY